MSDIIVITMAGTNLLTVVTPLDGSIKRQATILNMACLSLVQQYLTGVAALHEQPLTIPVKAAAIYASEVMGRLITYCEDNYGKDVYLIQSLEDNTGFTHSVPIIVQRRPVYLHNLPADFMADTDS